MKRKSIKIAIIGVVLFELWANILAYRKHGSGYIWEEYLYIAVVLWAVMVYFFFYDLSMKYYKKRTMFILHILRKKPSGCGKKKKG